MGATRFTPFCYNPFRFLAFFGVRIDEARHVFWGDVDFEKGRFTSASPKKARPGGFR
jgi:integrase